MNLTILTTERQKAKKLIDEQAEVRRLNYITDGAGQAAVYSAKTDEATAYLAATSPVDADYLFLTAEVGLTGVDHAAVATAIVTLGAQWKGIAAALKATRLSTKQQIDAATSITAIAALVEGVTWPA